MMDSALLIESAEILNEGIGESFKEFCKKVIDFILWLPRKIVEFVKKILGIADKDEQASVSDAGSANTDIRVELSTYDLKVEHIKAPYESYTKFAADFSKDANVLDDVLAQYYDAFKDEDSSKKDKGDIIKGMMREFVTQGDEKTYEIHTDYIKAINNKMTPKTVEIPTNKVNELLEQFKKKSGTIKDYANNIGKSGNTLSTVCKKSASKIDNLYNETVKVQKTQDNSVAKTAMEMCKGVINHFARICNNMIKASKFLMELSVKISADIKTITNAANGSKSDQAESKETPADADDKKKTADDKG